MSVWDFSTTAASNGNSDAGINFSELQPAHSLNNSSRALMGRLAEFFRDIGGVVDSIGSAGAYSITVSSAFGAYRTGIIVSFKANHTNSGAGTLSANSIGAKPVYANGAVLTGGEITSGGIYLLSYDEDLNSSAGGWHLMNPKTTVAALTAASSITITDNSNYGLTITQAGNGGALKITNTGTGNALLIEDEASTDATPLVVTNDGQLVVGAPSSAAVIGGNLRSYVVSSTGFNQVFAATGNTGNGARCVFLKSRGGTLGTFAVANSGDTVGDLIFAVDDGTDYASIAARIQVQVDGTPGSNDTPGRLIFAVTPDGSDATVEAMRISNTGQVRLTASTTARAPFNIPAGTAPTSPANGDIAIEAAKARFYVGGAWYDFTALLKTIADLSVVSGDLIYGSGSAATSRLAIGTSNQALVVSGGLPSWATLTTSMISDAGLIYIGEWVYSSAVSTIDLTGLSAYKEVIAVFDGVSIDGAASVLLRTSADNGGAFATTGYESVLVTMISAGNATISTGVSLTRNGAAGHEYSGSAEITGLNMSNDKTEVRVNMRDRTTELYIGGGRYATARAENAIRVVVTSGNFDAGRIRFFGRK